jgi:hypothetical protein
MPGDCTSLSLDGSLVIPTRVLRFEASRCARIPSPPVEPPVLVLCLNQVTRQLFGELPQTLRADSGREPLPCTGLCLQLDLAFLATMRSHLTPLDTRSLEPSLLLSPLLGSPARPRPFAPALHLHKSGCNLHLQYSANSQSTTRCQSLITARNDHPPVLGRSGPQSPP